jgi:hypothetical protein
VGSVAESNALAATRSTLEVLNEFWLATPSQEESGTLLEVLSKQCLFYPAASFHTLFLALWVRKDPQKKEHSENFLKNLRKHVP